MPPYLYLLIGLLSSWAFAQAPDSTSISQVLATINQIDTFQATFLYTSKQANGQEGQNPIKGQIWVKGQQYHLVLAEQVLISNGQSIWTYLPQAHEVHISDEDPEQEAWNPAKLLTMHRKGFLPVACKTQFIDQESCDVVEWISQDSASAIIQINATVQQKDKKLKKIAALDSHQVWHSFFVEEFELKEDLPDTCFEFDLASYPDIEVIDLRE